jgi:hypothetical protein
LKFESTYKVNKLAHWWWMVTFKYLYNGVSVKFIKQWSPYLEKTFFDVWNDLYSKHHFKSTPIIASSCGRCGSIDWVWLTFVGTLITLPCILYCPSPYSL